MQKLSDHLRGSKVHPSLYYHPLPNVTISHPLFLLYFFPSGCIFCPKCRSQRYEGDTEAIPYSVIISASVGLPQEYIVTASFVNSVFRVPYFVTYNPVNKELVVAIRGSLSFQVGIPWYTLYPYKTWNETPHLVYAFLIMLLIPSIGCTDRCLSCSGESSWGFAGLGRCICPQGIVYCKLNHVISSQVCTL